MTDRQILIENHNDYMLEIKLTHFKNELTLLVENLIQLDSETRTNNVGMPLSPIKSSKHRKILLNIITKGEELITEFNVLQEKFQDFENSETHINNKSLKNQIEILKNTLKEADSKIYEIDNRILIDQDKINDIQKQNSNLLEKINKYKKTLNDYEVAIQSKNYELHKYKELIDNKSNEINVLNTRLHTTITLQNNIEDNPDIVIPMNDNSRLSKDYMIKLNEGNTKVINQKNDKISVMNNNKQNPSVEIPLRIEMELISKTEEITSLKYKIKKLEEVLLLHAQNNLNTPLLTVSPRTKNRKCSGCSIL